MGLVAGSWWLEVAADSVTTGSAYVVGTEAVVDASNVVDAAVVVVASVVVPGKSVKGGTAVEDSVVVSGMSVTVGPLDTGAVVPVVGIAVVEESLGTESRVVAVPSSVATVGSASVAANEALPATGTLVVAEDSTKS